MITLSIATGIISFLIAVLKVALGSNEPEKVPLNEKEYDLMNYNSITETYECTRSFFRFEQCRNKFR